MVVTVILIMLTLLGLFFEYRSEHQVKEESKKRKYGMIILIVTFLGFAINSFSQYSDTTSLLNNIAQLKLSNETLTKRLQESENELKAVQTILGEVKGQNNSLLRSNEILTIVLNQNKVQLRELEQKTSAGFSQNQEYFENIKTSTISRNRILTTTQSSQISAELSSKKGSKIAIEFPAGDTESLQFAKQFKDAFVSAGWKVTSMAYVVNPSDTMKELNLIINDAHSPPVPAILLYTALKNVGLDCQIVIDKRIEGDEVKLFIGKE